MLNRNILTFALLLAGLVLLAGCKMPRPSPAPATPSVPDGGAQAVAPPDDNQSASTPEVSPTPIPAVSPTPLPDPPAGWQEYASTEMGISLYYPPDWEVILFDAWHIDVRAGQGEGWIEVYVVDSTNADDFSLEPEMVGDPESIIQAQFIALQENGDFSPFAPLETRFGFSAYSTKGTYSVLEDLLWLAVLDLGERAVIAQGHSLAEVEGWDTNLVPTYEQILWSITPYTD